MKSVGNRVVDFYEAVSRLVYFLPTLSKLTYYICQLGRVYRFNEYCMDFMTIRTLVDIDVFK